MQSGVDVWAKFVHFTVSLSKAYAQPNTASTRRAFGFPHSLRSGGQVASAFPRVLRTLGAGDAYVGLLVHDPGWHTRREEDA